MKIKLLPILTALLFICITPIYAEIKCSIEGEQLVLNFKSVNYRTEVTGNAVTHQFQKKNKAYFEVHINPSLSELVIFNLKTKKFETFLYTRYFINSRMDILTIIDPPHFSSEEESLVKEITVNGVSVCSFNKADDIDVKIKAAKFEIYSDNKRIGYISGNKDGWIYREYRHN